MTSKLLRIRDTFRPIQPLSLACFGALLLWMPISQAQMAAADDGRPATRPAYVQNGDVQPSESLGPDDLVEITVSYCPELTRNFRVGSDGALSLPLLHHKLVVAGLTPDQVSDKLQKQLSDEHIMTDPSVNVSVLEYRSRPVSVVGAVGHPLTFQATGRTTLLDAIARAGGLTPTAGSTIIVTDNHASAVNSATGTLQANVKIIPLHDLMSGADPKYNLVMTGGEEIRIPEASKITVAGDVKKPNVYPMLNEQQTTVMRAIALAGGLDSFSAKVAYICRKQTSDSTCTEIEVPIRKIMKRESPDVELAADDLLFIPTDNGMKVTVRVLNDLAGFGSAAGAGLLIYH